MNKRKLKRRQSRAKEHMRIKANNEINPRVWTPEQLKVLAAMCAMMSDLAGTIDEIIPILQRFADWTQRQEGNNPPG